MYLSLYIGSLLNYFLIKLLILSNISEYFLNISLSSSKKIMYLLFSSKHLAYAFIWGRSAHNGDGKALALCFHPIKYLNESLLYGFFYNNTISLISSSLILMGLLFLRKALLMMPFSLKYTASCSMFCTIKGKKKSNFLF